MLNECCSISYQSFEPTEKANQLVILNLNVGATISLISYASSVGRSLGSANILNGDSYQ
jgi:hypothetical protein